jgi:hypothetical protein
MPAEKRYTPSAAMVWDVVARSSFAVISHVTPSGAPRSSGVVYTVSGERMYVVVAEDSWEARHIRDEGLVAVSVPVRRGGLLSRFAPIPPATISFPAVATVHPAALLDDVPGLARLVPPQRRARCVVLELRAHGHFVTYGIGVSLIRMREPRMARARVPVSG